MRSTGGMQAQEIGISRKEHAALFLRECQLLFVSSTEMACLRYRQDIYATLSQAEHHRTCNVLVYIEPNLPRHALAVAAVSASPARATAFARFRRRVRLP